MLLALPQVTVIHLLSSQPRRSVDATGSTALTITCAGIMYLGFSLMKNMQGMLNGCIVVGAAGGYSLGAYAGDIGGTGLVGLLGAGAIGLTGLGLLCKL